MMQELSIYPPENSDMYKSSTRRCDNKYIMWIIITILGVALFISGFKYSGHSSTSKGNSFLSSYVPSEKGTNKGTESITSEEGTEYTSELGSETGSETGSESHNGVDSSEYENSATEYGTPAESVNPSSGDHSSSQSYILILTEGRAGSTWLSSFFWNSPDVFYVYEPLHYTPALHSHQCHDSDTHRRACDQEILSSIYACNFHTSVLTVLGQFPSYKKSCKNCTTPQLEDECQRSTHIVPKVILLHDLNDLEDLVSKRHLDIKVIHLVRDARPLVKARSGEDFGTIDGVHKHPVGGYTDEMLSEESKVLCERVLDASKLGDNPPSWLQGRYMRVTHEEISTNPVKVAKEVYTFTNLVWNEQTEQAIINSTIGRNRLDNEAWKRTMSAHSISIITASCKDMLEYLGYLNPLTTSNLGEEVQPSGSIGDEIEDNVSGDNEVYAELAGGEGSKTEITTTYNTDQTNRGYSTNDNIIQNAVAGDTGLENTSAGDTGLENGSNMVEGTLYNNVENTVNSS